jgi:ubiquinone/menaquinone biosynthesis C-methylase UbiE
MNVFHPKEKIIKMNKLGLPLEYKKLPEYFDVHNLNDDTNAKNAVIENFLKAHGVHTVLDLTCGTGSQVFFLAQRGYNVIGSDFSAALLNIAKEKACAEKLDIRFIEGDMRTLKVGTFDAVITIFNSIGHLTKLGFEKALRNIHKNLKDGGIYIFDIFNLDAMTDRNVADLTMYTHDKIQDTQIHQVQYSTIDRVAGRLTSYDHYTIQKHTDKPKRFYNQFSLQIYTANELKEILTRNGFETIAQYGMDGKEFIPNKTLSILTIAQRNDI